MLRGPEHLLGVFELLRKSTLSFVMSLRSSVCLSVRIEQLGFHLTDFFKKLIFVHFSEICQENSGFIEVGQELRVLYMNF